MCKLTLAHKTSKHELTMWWAKHCGTDLYGGFSDDEPQAVAELSQRLRQEYATPTMAPISHPDAAHVGGTNTPSLRVHGLAQSTTPGQGRSSSETSSFSQDSTVVSIDSNSALKGTNNPLTCNFVELCVNSGQLCQTLAEIDTTNLKRDVEQFRRTTNAIKTSEAGERNGTSSFGRLLWNLSAFRWRISRQYVPLK